MSLPQTHRALVVRDVNVEPQVEVVPIPECMPGTIVLKVIASPVLSYTKDVFIGNSRKYTYPMPIVPGMSCIGRVAAVPEDVASSELKIGSLAFFNCTVRSRTNDRSGVATYLQGLHDGYSVASKALMANGGCKDGSYAEYMRAPIENIFTLDEARLLKSSTSKTANLGYTPSDLCNISRFLVPYGGLRSINLLPGESILVGPATGSFGCAAVILALALGAKVVAWGRKQSKLDNLKEKIMSIQGGRYASMFDTVVLTNDAAVDAEAAITANSNKKFDAIFDITPPSAAGSSYIKSAILTLRHSGRASLMGGIADDVSLPHSFIMHYDITIKGKWMYDRSDIIAFLQLVEYGVLRLDEDGAASKIIGSFNLNDWRAAWDLAYDHDGPGELVVITPEV